METVCDIRLQLTLNGNHLKNIIDKQNTDDDDELECLCRELGLAFTKRARLCFLKRKLGEVSGDIQAGINRVENNVVKDFEEEDRNSCNCCIRDLVEQTEPTEAKKRKTK